MSGWLYILLMGVLTIRCHRKRQPAVGGPVSRSVQSMNFKLRRMSSDLGIIHSLSCARVKISVLGSQFPCVLYPESKQLYIKMIQVGTVAQ